MRRFDVDAIGEEAIRERYTRLEKRARAVAGAIREGLGAGHGEIRTRFVEGELFNAFAGADGPDYRIAITAPVPLLLVILFDKLLSDPRLLPWLETGDDGTGGYKVPFIVDPADFAGRQDWSIALSPVRSLAAGILADIALTFVLLHEAGHIICGHVEAARRSGQQALAEMFTDPGLTRDENERRRAWEADADAVAATLLMDYLDQVASTNESYAEAKAIFGHGETTIEHILSLTIVALYAMFAYLRGARHALGLASSHPHPFVRAHFVKDMLIMSARQRWPLDVEAVAGLMDDRLDEMLIVLEAVGLSENARIDDAYIEQTNAEIDQLVALREAHRSSARAWFAWETVDFRESDVS